MYAKFYEKILTFTYWKLTLKFRRCPDSSADSDLTICLWHHRFDSYIQISKSYFLEKTLKISFVSINHYLLSIQVYYNSKKIFWNIIVAHTTTFKIPDYAVTSQTPNGSHRVVRNVSLNQKKLNISKLHKIKTNKDTGLKFEMGITWGVGNTLLKEFTTSDSTL